MFEVVGSVENPVSNTQSQLLVVYKNPRAEVNKQYMTVEENMHSWTCSKVAG